MQGSLKLGISYYHSVCYLLYAVSARRYIVNGPVRVLIICNIVIFAIGTVYYSRMPKPAHISVQLKAEIGVKVCHLEQYAVKRRIRQIPYLFRAEIIDHGLVDTKVTVALCIGGDKA